MLCVGRRGPIVNKRSRPQPRRAAATDSRPLLPPSAEAAAASLLPLRSSRTFRPPIPAPAPSFRRNFHRGSSALSLASIASGLLLSAAGRGARHDSSRNGTVRWPPCRRSQLADVRCQSSSASVERTVAPPPPQSDPGDPSEASDIAPIPDARSDDGAPHGGGAVARDHRWERTLELLRSPLEPSSAGAEAVNLLNLLRSLAKDSYFKKRGHRATTPHDPRRMMDVPSSQSGSGNISARMAAPTYATAPWYADLDVDFVRAHQPDGALTEEQLERRDRAKSLLEAIQQGTPVPPQHLVDLLAPTIPALAGRTVERGPPYLRGIPGETVWLLYRALTKTHPESLVSFRPHHWNEILRAAIHAALPCRLPAPSKLLSSEEAFKRLEYLPVRATRFLVDMKKSGRHPDVTMYKALYRGFLLDPKQAVAVHRFVVASIRGAIPVSSPKQKTVTPNLKLMNDESAKTLLSVLVFGGDPRYWKRQKVELPPVTKAEIGCRSAPLQVLDPPDLRTGLLVREKAGALVEYFDAASATEQLLRDMGDLEIHHSAKTMLGFLHAFSIWGDFQLVLRVHTSLIKFLDGPDRQAVYEGLIVAYYRLGTHNAVLRIADDMASNGVLPTVTRAASTKTCC
ncbi:hypothetical protein DFJ73DRAFT_420776 [Zopfochytrium polystomum]|nr:hypothetical protein DFJ73DRAFT_420776 [Zopfochytrium polystomum]